MTPEMVGEGDASRDEGDPGGFGIQIGVKGNRLAVIFRSRELRTEPGSVGDFNTKVNHETKDLTLMDVVQRCGPEGGR